MYLPQKGRLAFFSAESRKRTGAQELTHARHVTRLEQWRVIPRPDLLSFRGIFRSPRTLGNSVARSAGAGKDVSAGPDSGRYWVPPLSARQPRGNHFAAA